MRGKKVFVFNGISLTTNKSGIFMSILVFFFLLWLACFLFVFVFYGFVAEIDGELLFTFHMQIFLKL